MKSTTSELGTIETSEALCLSLWEHFAGVSSSADSTACNVGIAKNEQFGKFGAGNNDCSDKDEKNTAAYSNATGDSTDARDTDLWSDCITPVIVDDSVCTYSIVGIALQALTSPELGAHRERDSISDSTLTTTVGPVTYLSPEDKDNQDTDHSNNPNNPNKDNKSIISESSDDLIDNGDNPAQGESVYRSGRVSYSTWSEIIRLSSTDLNGLIERTMVLRMDPHVRRATSLYQSHYEDDIMSNTIGEPVEESKSKSKSQDMAEIPNNLKKNVPKLRGMEWLSLKSFFGTRYIYIYINST